MSEVWGKENIKTDSYGFLKQSWMGPGVIAKVALQSSRDISVKHSKLRELFNELKESIEERNRMEKGLHDLRKELPMVAWSKKSIVRERALIKEINELRDHKKEIQTKIENVAHDFLIHFRPFLRLKEGFPTVQEISRLKLHFGFFGDLRNEEERNKTLKKIEAALIDIKSLANFDPDKIKGFVQSMEKSISELEIEGSKNVAGWSEELGHCLLDFGKAFRQLQTIHLELIGIPNYDKVNEYLARALSGDAHARRLAVNELIFHFQPFSEGVKEKFHIAYELKIRCPRCNADMPSHARFCGVCGAELPKVTTATKRKSQGTRSTN